MWSKATDGKSFMVCGPVGGDAEYKQVGQNNSSLTKFSVKNDDKTLEDGTVKPMWTNCECWHSVARYARAIKKGDTVLAIGTIKTDTWTDQQTGEQKTAKKLVCDFVAILPLTQNQQTPPQQNTGFVPADTKNTNVTVQKQDDDDYPF